MAISIFPKWVILMAVGVILLMIVARHNYHLTPMSKARIECLQKKPEKQRNKYTIRVRRRFGKGQFALMALAAYGTVSICFAIEDHGALLDAISGNLAVGMLIGVLVWLLVAGIVTFVCADMMEYWQDEACAALKRYYSDNFGIIITNVSEKEEANYYEYVDSYNELSKN